MKLTIKYLIILISISANAQLVEKTTTYSYDNLNRLVQVVFNDGTQKNYIYDDLGNRTQLHITTLSINAEALQNPIVIFPNPASHILNITIPPYFQSKNPKIQVFDVNGKHIQNLRIAITKDQITINVNTLSNGVYIVYMQVNDKNWSKIFIKK